MDDKPNDGESTEKPASMVGTGLAIGISIGVALGAAFDDVAIGIALGVALGAAFGAALDQHRKKGKSRLPAFPFWSKHRNVL